MQITGSRPKVDALDVDSGMGPSGGGQPVQNNPVEDYFDNAFGNGASGTTPGSTVGNPDPIDDYTFGDIQAGQAVADDGADTSAWLSNFPPSLEEIVAGNENAVAYLDLVMQRYEQAKSDLRRLRDTYNQALASGTLSITQAESLNSRLGLITQALARCDSEIQKVTQQSGRQEILYIDELQSMQDLDNNGWVGRARANGSYYVRQNTDGTTTFFDPRTRRAIPNPLMDPEYEPRITDSGSLAIVDNESAHEMPTGETVDLNLRLTPEALSNFSQENIYQAPIDIGIPEYIWVEKRGEGDGEEPFQMQFNSEAAEDKMVIYDNWSSEGGLHQVIPSDMSRYMQVQVTEVKIRSVDSGLKDAAGNILYDHVVELYNGDYLISRMQIEGFNGEGPGSTATQGGGNYVSASTVGFSIHGSQRATPVRIDASDYISTGYHRFSGVAEKLGISAPGNTNGDEKFYNNVNFFEAGEYSQNGGIERDRYVQANLPTGPHAVSDPMFMARDPSENPELSAHTGIFVRDLRGDITGTNFNDVIMTDGVNELSEYARDHLPEDRREIQKGDAFYSNRIQADRGNNIVVAGRGDNYIFDATLAWIEGGGNDENYITTPRVVPGRQGSSGSQNQLNPSTFVHVDGGSAHIVNPDEIDNRAMGRAEDEAVRIVGQLLSAYNGDEFDTIFDLVRGLGLSELRSSAPSSPNNDNLITVAKQGNLQDTVIIDKRLFEANGKDELENIITDILENSVGSAEHNDYYESVSGSASYTDPDDEDIVGSPSSEVLDAETITSVANEPMQKWYEELTRVPEVDETGPQISWDDVMGASTELDSEMNSFFGEMFGGINDLFGDSGSSDPFDDRESGSTPPSEGTI